MTGEVYKLADTDIQMVMQAERSRRREMQLDLMNTVCANVVEAGGECDRAAFEFGMLGGDPAGHDFADSPQDERVVEEFVRARSFAYRAGDIFTLSDSEKFEDWGWIDTLSLILPSKPSDLMSPAVRYKIHENYWSEIRPYYGSVDLDCISLVVPGDWGDDRERTITEEKTSVIGLHRDAESLVSQVWLSDLVISPRAVVGLADIRYQADEIGTEMREKVELTAARLVQRYVELQNAGQISLI